MWIKGVIMSLEIRRKQVERKKKLLGNTLKYLYELGFVCLTFHL